MNRNNRKKTYVGAFDFAGSTNDPDGLWPTKSANRGWTVVHSDTGVFTITLDKTGYKVVPKTLTVVQGTASSDMLKVTAVTPGATGGATVEITWGALDTSAVFAAANPGDGEATVFFEFDLHFWED
jgi:hypothetical protein